MVVQGAGPGAGTEVLEEVLALIGLAVTVVVAEDAQIGHVHDVERIAIPGHAKDGPEPLGEADGFRTLTEEEDAAVVRFVRPNLVHRVLGDEQSSAGGRGDLAGILEGRHAGDQAAGETVGHPRQVPERGRGHPCGEPTEADRDKGRGPASRVERHCERSPCGRRERTEGHGRRRGRSTRRGRSWILSRAAIRFNDDGPRRGATILSAAGRGWRLFR